MSKRVTVIMVVLVALVVFLPMETVKHCYYFILDRGSYHTQPIVKNIIDNRRSGFGGMQYTSVRSLFSSVGGLYHMKALRQVFFSVLLAFQLNTP